MVMDIKWDDLEPYQEQPGQDFQDFGEVPATGDFPVQETEPIQEIRFGDLEPYEISQPEQSTFKRYLDTYLESQVILPGNFLPFIGAMATGFKPAAPEDPTDLEVSAPFLEGSRRVLRAPLEFGQMVTDAVAEISGEEEPSEFFRDLAASDLLGEDIAYLKRARDKEGIIKYAEDVIGLAPQIASQVAMHYIGGKPLSMLWMGTQIAGPYYENLLEQGVAPRRAMIAALANAAMQAPLESIGLGFMFKKFGGTLTQRIAKKILAGGGAEFITEWLQKYPELVTDVAAKDPEKGKRWLALEEPWKDEEFVTEFLEATKEGLYEGLVAMPFGVLGGGATAGSDNVDPVQGDMSESEYKAAVEEARKNIDKAAKNPVVQGAADAKSILESASLSIDVDEGIQESQRQFEERVKQTIDTANQDDLIEKLAAQAAGVETVSIADLEPFQEGAAILPEGVEQPDVIRYQELSSIEERSGLEADELVSINERFAEAGFNPDEFLAKEPGLVEMPGLSQAEQNQILINQRFAQPGIGQPGVRFEPPSVAKGREVDKLIEEAPEAPIPAAKPTVKKKPIEQYFKPPVPKPVKRVFKTAKKTFKKVTDMLEAEEGVSAIPELRTSRQAIQYGRSATPEEIDVVRRLESGLRSQSEALLKQKKYQASSDAATMASFYREAREVAEGTFQGSEDIQLPEGVPSLRAWREDPNIRPPWANKGKFISGVDTRGGRKVNRQIDAEYFLSYDVSTDVSEPGAVPMSNADLMRSFTTYEQGSKVASDKNVYIKQVPSPDNSKRVLMVQISSEMMRQFDMGEAYFDKLYDTREGYERPKDFWEIPEWIAEAAQSLPNGDVYVVRNPIEAKTFLERSGYGTIMFSAMDSNKAIIKDLVAGFPGNVTIGGYVPASYFKGLENVKYINSLEEAAKEAGQKFKPGVDYRHFKGTKTIPRLCMSKGCLHKCAFCVVPKEVVETPMEMINEQLKSFQNLDYSLIYLNDKTFGQSKNYKQLATINKFLKRSNKKFKGFIVQTTAPQFLKMSPEFIAESGIKYLEIGVETFNDEFLKNLKKPHNTDLIKRAADKARALNINFIPNVMVGLAGVKGGKLWTETGKTYRNTLDFLNDNSDIISHVNVYNLATYEGTALGEQLQPTGAEDVNENAVEKSWLKNQELHEGYYKQFLKFGSKQLSKTKPKVKETPRARVVSDVKERLKKKVTIEDLDIVETLIEIDWNSAQELIKVASAKDPMLVHNWIGWIKSPAEKGKKAIDVTNEPRHAALREYSKLVGKDFRIYNNKNGPSKLNDNGTHNKITGQIWINEDSTNPVLATVNHEVFHNLKKKYPNFYARFTKIARKYVSPETLEKHTDIIDPARKKYTEEQAFDEFMADGLGDFTTDPKFYKEVGRRDLPLLKKIWELFKDIIGKMAPHIRSSKYIGDYWTDVDFMRRLYAEIYVKGVRANNNRAAKASDMVKVDSILQAEASKAPDGAMGTPLGDTLKWDVLDIIKKAKGADKVGDFMARKRVWKGMEMTPAGVKYISNLAKNMSKDKKRMSEFKAVKSMRDKIAKGQVVEGTKAYADALKKFGAKLEGHTIQHVKRFFVAKTRVYGKPKKGDTKQTVKRFHVLRGEFEYDQYRDGQGNLIQNTPILAKSPKVRERQIDSILEKNKQHLNWYRQWNEFMMKFVGKGEYAGTKLTPELISKFIKIQAITSRSAGPQGNQKLFTKVANALILTGTVPGDLEASDRAKVRAIWNDLDKEAFIGQTLRLDERQEEYGRKVGAYMAAGLNPEDPNALVIDRHMPRLWGYDITWSANGEHSAFRIKPVVEAEIVRDIIAAARRHNLPPSAVQAGLWYETRLPDVEASSYIEAARISPSEYMPFIFKDALSAEDLGMGVHYRGVNLQKGEYSLAASRDGKVQYNSYSRDDVGNRMAQHTPANPYAPLVYFYEVGVEPEVQVRTGRKGYNIDFSKYKIYNAIDDPLGYSETVNQRIEADPGAHPTNVLANLLEDTGDFDGLVVPNPYGDGRWVLMFKRVAMDAVPQEFDVGISDTVESLEEISQDVSEIKENLPERGNKLHKKIVDVKKKYREITIAGFKPTIAKTEATSTQLELGAMLRLNGPAPAARAMLAELGISNLQRNIYMMHTEGEPNGQLWKFKVRKDLDTVEAVAQKIAEYGLEDYNIAISPQSGNIFIEQFIFDDPDLDSSNNVKQFAKLIEDIHDPVFPGNTRHEVNSEVLGDPMFTEDPANALQNFKQDLIAYWGKKKGEQIYDQALEARKEYEAEVLAKQIVRKGIEENPFNSEQDKEPSERYISEPTDLPRDELGHVDEEEIIEPDGEWRTEDPQTVLSQMPDMLEFEDSTLEDADIDDTARTIIKEKIGQEDKPFKQRMQDAWRNTNIPNYLRTKLVDRLYPIRDLAGKYSSIYMHARGVPGGFSSVKSMMEHGKLKFDETMTLTTDTRNEGFIPWLNKLDKGDRERFFYWMVATRAQRLLNIGKERWLDQGQIDAIMNWVGEKPTGADSWNTLWNQFNEYHSSVVKLAVDSGLLSQEEVDAWGEEVYVPFYRVFENEATRDAWMKMPQKEKGKLHLSARIHKLFGADIKLGDPVENIMKNWTHLITESVANVARGELYDFATAERMMSGREGIRDGETVQLPLVEPVPVNKTTILRPVEGQPGGKTVYVENKTGDPVLSFRREGKPYFFKVNDPELFQAAANMNRPMFGGFVMKALTGTKRWLTYGATFGPAFKIKNMIRDTLHTWVITPGWDFKPFWDTARGAVKAWRNDPDMVAFMASGHAFGGSYIKEDSPGALNKYVKQLVKAEGEQSFWGRMLNTPKKMLAFWERVGDVSENAARVALYANLRGADKSHLEAAFRARDIMDFQMSGAAGAVQFLTTSIPFLNARMQGLYRMGSGMAENPKSFVAKGAMITLASMALWLAYKDDDRYKELPNFEKWGFYNFWIGDKHYRMPKPFETGAIFSSMFESAGNVMVGNEDFGHFMDFTKHTLNENFMINPLNIQLVKPLYEQWANKSSFTGRPIEGQSMQGLNWGERYDPWTSETTRLAGRLGIPPKRAERLIRGYFGTLGQFILGISDIFVRNAFSFPERPAWRLEDYPMINAIARNTPARYTQTQTEFYDTLREMNATYKTLQHYKRLGDFDKARGLVENNKKDLRFRSEFNRVSRQLSELNKRIRFIWSDTEMDGDEKRRKIDQIIEQRSQIINRIYTRFEE